MGSLFRNGDVLVTYGTGGIWPPRRLLLWPVYDQIKDYQYRKWIEHFRIPDADYLPTHVRIFLEGRFFEATVPHCKWTDIADLSLNKKKWKLVRYKHYDQLCLAKMLAVANEFDGKPYDKGDLLDFALSGWLRRYKHTISLFGDREQKIKVCSTLVAHALYEGGAEFSMALASIDPAYFVNMKKEYNLIAKDNF